MSATKTMPAWQFTAFRIFFGGYLVCHFGQLLPYASELFGSTGVLSDPRLNPLHGVLPNPLAAITWPWFPCLFVGVLTILAAMFTAGVLRRTSALVLWYGWACLFNRNNLIANPGIPYVGLLLLLCVLVPAGEPLSRKQEPAWRMPSMIYCCVWILLAAGYTYSGIWKLFSPSWVDGTALLHLLDNPLARPGPFRDLLRDLSTVLPLLTWTALAGEILFLPLSLTSRGRAGAWLWMAAMHVGILLVVDFADLTLGMLMVHLFTFDPAWIPARRTRAVLLFDGQCGMCNRWVQFVRREASEAVFNFVPLQSDEGQKLLEASGLPTTYRDSLVVMELGNQKVSASTKSSAVMRVLASLGGFWRLLTIATIIPPPIRDWCYDQIALRRHRWFPQTTCEFVPKPQPFQEQITPSLQQLDRR